MASVSSASLWSEVISRYISSIVIVLNGVSVALFTVLPVFSSFTGDMGGMKSDILNRFSILLL